MSARPAIVDPYRDARFETIEHAVTLLKLLPPPDRLALPARQPDVDALDQAIDCLSRLAPELERAWSQHLLRTAR